MRIDLSPIEKGDRVLCAVSGGADSMCMLHALASAGVAVAAAHFEHGIRGEESLRDARFVEKWCADNGIECVTAHENVPQYAKSSGLGTEEAARKLRYEFLSRTAEELGCRYIATAHNADDNAETVLFNLARGTGAKGLRGIPPRRDNIIRPLLHVTRAEIEQYLADNAVPHVEDSTNASDDYSRNLIRHSVMPVMRDINPGFAEAVSRTAALIRQDEACLDELAEDFIAKHYAGESLPIAELNELHSAVSSRVIRSLCDRSLEAVHIDAITALLAGSEKASVDIPGQTVRREQGRLYFNAESAVEPWDVELVPGRETVIPQARLVIRTELAVKQEEINNKFKTYLVKCESIKGTLRCTQRRPGDSLRIAGRGCTKTLKSLFTEKKLTSLQRDSTAVIRDGAGVVAVEGLAFAERCAAEPGDEVIRIEIKKY